MLETDQIGFLLDDDGDIDLSNGLVFATGLQAVAQGIRSRIQMVKGEWFLDLNLGVPWYEGNGVSSTEAILGGKFDATRARQIFSSAITSAPGVTSLISLQINFNGSTRTMTVDWKVQTVFDEVVADVTEI